MSVAPGSNVGTRRPRGRLLIVDDSLQAELAGRLSPAPVRVADLFEAIGEISAAPAREPIVAALVSAAAFESAGGEAAAAIKRLDPAVHVVRIVNGTGTPPRPSIEGVDEDLATPEDITDFIERLGTSVSPPIESAPSAHPVPVVVTATPPRPARAAPAPVHPTQTRARVTEDLGDIDLVRAVMESVDGVTPVALRLIGQSTGWSDVTFVASETEADASATRVAVMRGSATAGWLSARGASASAVETWAQWLGRWLELDDAYRAYRKLAYRDDLTGAWNRRYFRRFLDETIVVARERRHPVTVMVFDIDDFKQYNDEFGHEAGDVILRETVALLTSVIRTGDRVCRIGGDEFAVVFGDLGEPRTTGSRHPESVEQIARRFQEQVCQMRFPKLGRDAPGQLSISGGLATFPWDGDGAEALLRLADQRALESKRRGKNHLTFGVPEVDERSGPLPL